MTTDKQLLPCPFCGGEAILDDVSSFLGDAKWSPACETEDCVMWNAKYATQREAAAAWNTRMEAVRPPVGEEAVERVAKAMQQARDEIGATEQQRIAFAYAEAAMRSAMQSNG
jgi:hypothetical protein